jgi:hypothetical protein
MAAATFTEGLKKTDTSFWESIMPALLRAWEIDAPVSPTALVRRLPSGRLLTLKFLPISTTKTSVECNIYGGESRHTKATQLELESAKKEVQLMIQQIELEQRELIIGDPEIQNCKCPWP